MSLATESLPIDTGAVLDPSVDDGPYSTWTEVGKPLATTDALTLAVVSPTVPSEVEAIDGGPGVTKVRSGPLTTPVRLIATARKWYSVPGARPADGEADVLE